MPPAAAQGNGHEAAAGAGGVSEHRLLDVGAENLAEPRHDLAERGPALDWLNGDGHGVDCGVACLQPESVQQEE